MVTTFQLIPFQNKLVALAFTGSGGICYLPTTDQFKLFEVMYYTAKIRLTKAQNY